MEKQTMEEEKPTTNPSGSDYDNENLPIMRTELMCRLAIAKLTKQGLCLNLAEIQDLLHICKHLTDNLVCEHDSCGKFLKVVGELAKLSKQKSEPFQLNVSHIEKLTLSLEHASAHNSEPGMIASPFGTHLDTFNEYDDYNSDGSHPLDGQMDMSTDYSKNVQIPMTTQDFNNMVNTMTTAEIQEFSKIFFLIKASTIMKLRNVKKLRLGIAYINRVETIALLDSQRSLSQGNLEAVFKAHLYHHPSYTVIRKLIRGVQEASGTLLTRPEIKSLLQACRPFPIPQLKDGKANDTHDDTLEALDLTTYGISEDSLFAISEQAFIQEAMVVASQRALFSSKIDAATTLLPKQAIGLHIACQRVFHRHPNIVVEEKAFPRHPQITAMRKLFRDISEDVRPLSVKLEADEMSCLSVIAVQFASELISGYEFRPRYDIASKLWQRTLGSHDLASNATLRPYRDAFSPETIQDVICEINKKVYRIWQNSNDVDSDQLEGPEAQILIELQEALNGTIQQLSDEVKQLRKQRDFVQNAASKSSLVNSEYQSAIHALTHFIINNKIENMDSPSAAAKLLSRLQETARQPSNKTQRVNTEEHGDQHGRAHANSDEGSNIETWDCDGLAREISSIADTPELATQAWRVFPTSEIAAWKQRVDSTTAHADSLQESWDEQVKARAEAETLTQWFMRAYDKERYRADSNAEYVSYMQLSWIEPFFEQVLPLLSNKVVDAYSRNSAFDKILDIVTEGLGDLIKERDSLKARCESDEKSSTNLAQRISALAQTHVADHKALLSEENNMNNRLDKMEGCFRAIEKDMDSSHKQILNLKKHNAAKDKKLEQNEKDLIYAREARGLREEKLCKELQTLEQERNVAQAKSEAARKEIESVKSVWQKKLQNGFNKTRNLEAELKEQKELYDILKLDHEATLQEAQDLKATKIQKTEEDNKINNLQKEIEGLKTRLRTMRTNPKIENDKTQKAVRDAVAPKDVTIENLEEKIQKLKLDHNSDIASIRELSLAKENLNLKGAEKDKEIVSLKQHVAAMDKNYAAVRRDLDEERSKVKQLGKDEAVAGLEVDLAAERLKSKRLEDQLAIFLNAAATIQRAA